MLSLIQTTWNQLSPIRLADGFETTSCLKCLQIIGVSYVAGGPALKLETGYCVSYLDLAFQKGASFCNLSLSYLLYSCVFIKRKKCNMLPLFPLIHIQHSTFHRRPSVPLSLQNGKRFAFFLFIQLLVFCFL